MLLIVLVYLLFGRQVMASAASQQQLQSQIASLETLLHESQQSFKALEQTRKYAWLVRWVVMTGLIAVLCFHREEDEKTSKIKALLVKTRKELADARQVGVVVVQ